MSSVNGLIPRATPAVVSLYRIVIALFFVLHGAASLFGVFGGNQGKGHAVEVGTWPGWWAALIQLVAGGLVLIGLFTGPAALLASGSMAYAYFSVHQEKALLPLQNGGEAAAMFCWAFFLIAMIGPGPFSLDALFGRVRADRGASAGEAVSATSGTNAGARS